MYQALGQVWSKIPPGDFEEVAVPLKAPVHFGARLLHNHWKERQAAGGFRLHRDLPTRELSPALRNLAVFEPVEKARDFRIRVAGSAYLRRFGYDVTGLALSEIHTEKRFACLRPMFAKMLKKKKPFGADITLRNNRRERMHFEALNLPVLSETGEIWALAGLFHHDWVG